MVKVIIVSKKDKHMWSRYNRYLKDFPKAGYVTIYNLFTKKSVCYRSDLLNSEGSIKDDHNEKMQKYGIITDSYERELHNVIEHYKTITNSHNKLKLMIVLTSDCNCCCKYCYEKSCVDRFSVFDDNAKRKLYEFVQRKISDNKSVENISVIFYGGEPLLQNKVITEISTFFHDKYGDKYYFSIITNGTLIKKSTLEHWKNIGLRILKITIDGNEQSHNRRRPYNDGRGTYKDILTNLEKVPNEVETRVNIVLDNEVDGVEELLSDLAKLKSSNITISLNPVEPWIGSYKEEADIILKYATILKNKNFFQYSKLAGTHGDICEGKLNNFYTIDGDGNIYECNGKFYKIGELGEDIKRTNFEINKECKDCKYLPICFGDCIYGKDCHKDFFEYICDSLLKIYLSFK